MPKTTDDTSAETPAVDRPRPTCAADSPTCIVKYTTLPLMNTPLPIDSASRIAISLRRSESGGITRDNGMAMGMRYTSYAEGYRRRNAAPTPRPGRWAEPGNHAREEI